jgi:hypothetical protein
VFKSRKSGLVRKGRFLVFDGKSLRRFDLTKAVEMDRDERMQKIWGRGTGISARLQLLQH